MVCHAIFDMGCTNNHELGIERVLACTR